MSPDINIWIHTLVASYWNKDLFITGDWKPLQKENTEVQPTWKL